MPYKRRPTTTRRRNYRKRRLPFRRRTSYRSRPKNFSSLSTPIPNKYYCKITYAEVARELGLSAATLGNQAYRMNGLFDPDLTGVGHQPYIYDQMSTLYNRYRVYAAKITITAQVAGATKPVYGMLDANNGNAGLLIVDPNVAMEYFTSKSKMITTDGSQKIFKAFYRMHPLFGVSKMEYNTDQGYNGLTGGAGVGSDPTKPIYAYFFAYSSNAITVYYSVRITYYVCFYERKTNNAS